MAEPLRWELSGTNLFLNALVTSKEKATTAKPLVAPGIIKEIGLTFYNEINEIVHAHEIPPEMIINIDQTPLPFVLISKYTLDKKVAPVFLYLGLQSTVKLLEPLQ